MSVTPTRVTPSPTDPGILELALSLVTDAIVWIDAQQRVQGCNPAFERLLDRSHDLVGQTLPHLLPLEPLSCSPQRQAHPGVRVLAGDEILEEYRFCQCDRTSILEISGRLLAADSQAQVAVLVIRDVTPVRQAAQTSEETLALLQSTLESTADGVLVVARNGTVLSYNQKFTQMWNIPEALVAPDSNARERFQYLANQTVDPEGFKARVIQLFDEMPEEAVFDGLTMKNGRIFERYSQPQWLNGEIVGRIWSYRDITQRQRAEEALRQSEEKFRRIVEQANDVIYLLTPEGKFAYVSPNVTAVAGFTPAEMEGQDFSPYVHPDDLQRCVEALQSVMHSGDRVFNLEFRSPHKAGHWTWQCANLSLFQDANDQPMLLGVTRDISDRKRREESLRLIVEGTATHTGDAFFQSCAQYVASVLNVMGAWIGEFANDDKTRVRTLAAWGDGQLLDNFEFDLQGTPCEAVLQGQTCCFAQNLLNHFPEDAHLRELGLESYLGVPLLSSTGQVIGHVAVIDRKPMGPDPNRELILQIFAARAGAELERQQAETALRQREEKYRAIFENSQVGIGRTRIEDGLILEANQRFADIMGYESPADLIGKVCTQDLYVNPHDRETVLAVLNEEGGLQDFEVQLWRQEGTVTWGLLSLRLNLPQNCLEFVITDICERKRAEAERHRIEEDRQWAEAALRQREAEYRLLVETANSVILKWDAQGTVLYLNDYGQKFFGYEAEEIIGRNVVGTLVPETETTGRDLEILMTDLCRHPEMYMFNENENICKDGRRVWIAWANKPIINEQNQLVGILSIGADVTKRRRLEEDLRQSQQFLHKILDNIPITVFLKDVQNDFAYTLINQDCERILGFSRERGLGHNDYELLPLELAEHYRKQDLAILTSHRKVENFEEVRLPETGEQVYIRSTKLPLFDDQGNVTHLLGIGEDFTERKQREDALRLIVEGTASATGAEFFRTCVSYLAQVLQVRYAFIAELEDAAHARTLAYWADGAIAENFDYAIAGTPCAHMVLGQIICYSHQVKTLFPQSPRLQSMEAESYLGTPLIDGDGTMLGHLVVLDDQPMLEDSGREAILRIFAARAGAELKRMQAEAELRKSEERFRTLIANLPGAVYRCYKNDTATTAFLSDAVTEITGYHPSELIESQSIRLTDICLGNTAEISEAIRTAIAEHQPYVLEYPIAHADGSLRWVYEKGQGIFDADGRLLWLDGVIFDISDRKQADNLLDSQNQILEQIASGAPLDETLALLIEAFELLSGCKAGSILLLDAEGQHLHHAVAPHLSKAYTQAVDGLTIGPVAGSCGTAAYLKAPVIATDILTDPLWEAWRDLARQHALRSCWSVPIFGSQDQILGTFALYYERPHSPSDEDWQLLETAAHLAGIAIERKRTEEELYRAKNAAETANRAKSQFLANMSHELRTPMNAILGFTQLMARDDTLSERQRESLSVINHSGEHLLSLINDVLEMSKIEAGRVVLNPIPFNLYGLLQILREMFQIRAETKHLALRFEIDPQVPQYIIGDEGKLRQVLINLIGNAIKFTQSGSVTLRLAAINQLPDLLQPSLSEITPLSPPSSLLPPLSSLPTILRFEIADTGPGIASEILPILFQPFVQANGHVPGEGGTGLGLAITRQFIQLMGGRIDVDTKLGQGTTFQFEIGVTLAEPETVQAPISSRTVQRVATGQPSYRILVVDDRVENREPLRQLLESVGFETRIVVNGVEAVAQWQAWQPHLIWMDMRMPEMDGYEATRRIRKLEQQAGIPTRCPILAITASAFDDQRHEVFAAGCDDFIHKPFQVSVIFEKMAEHLGVQYLYADELPSSVGGARGTLHPTDLQVMPENWIANLGQAAIQADADWLRQLTREIPPTCDTLVNDLLALVDRFDFDTIVELVEAAVDA